MKRWFSVLLILHLLFAGLIVHPASVGGQEPSMSAEETHALIEHIEAIVRDLDPETRARIPALERRMAELRSLKNPPRSARAEEALVRARDHAHGIGLDLAAVTSVRQDEFGVRFENQLGRPDCPEGSDASHCFGDWLSTRSDAFHTIRKDAYFRGDASLPQGVQMASRFVAERDGTAVAIVFSANAYVQDDEPGANRRMFVRALVDGQVVDPADVVFAVGADRSVRQFIFTTRVDKGIHTVEIQWRVDREATAYVRDASLLVRTGTSQPSAHGVLSVVTPPSGLNLEKTTASWENIPGMGGWIWVPKDGVLTMSMSAETAALGGATIALRVLVSNDATLAKPSDVIFARDARPQSRGMTFGVTGLDEGWRSVQFQWLVDGGGTGILGDRTMKLAAYPTEQTHPFVAAPSGPLVTLEPHQWPVVPDMTTTVQIPAEGNGEVAVIFSAEVTSSAFIAALFVNGTMLPETAILFTDGGSPAETKSFVFRAKGLEPGTHQVDIRWFTGNPAGASMGDRTIAVMSEVGQVPDLAEPFPFAMGRIDQDHIGGIEPLVGSRNVLTILFDPRRCDDASPPANCVDQSDIPAQKVANALFGQGAGDLDDEVLDIGDAATNNVRSYYMRNSGGRFTIVNAGVLGWYDAPKPGSYYWNLSADSCAGADDGFTSGHVARLTHAVLAANPHVNFAQYDINGDGVVDSHELAIVVVVPQAEGTGSGMRRLLATQCPSNERMQLDGVVLPQYVVEWFTSLDDSYEKYQFGTAAHELLHVMAGLDDMYVSEDHATFPRKLSIMSDGRGTTTHLDGVHKLALGWVTPQFVEQTGNYKVDAVSKSNKVLVLPRRGNETFDEYYLIENRNQGLGSQYYDLSIGMSGLAVWHAVGSTEEAKKPPTGVTLEFWNTTAAAASEDDVGKGTMARWGIRLLRPWTNFENDKATFPGSNMDLQTLWHNGRYDLKSGNCILIIPASGGAENRLAWADCTPSGYNIKFLSPANESMMIRIEID